MKTLHANDKSSYLTMSHVRIKGGGAIAPGPPPQGGPPWWNLFVSNKYSFEKFRNSEAIQEYNSILYSYVALHIKGTRAPNSNWFIYKFDCLPVLVIVIEQPICIFGFVECKYIWFRWWFLPNNRSFGMGMTLYSCITPIAQMSRKHFYLHANS